MPPSCPSVSCWKFILKDNWRFRDHGTGWGWATRLLHWLMAVLIFGMLGLGFYMVQVETDLVNRYLQTQWHKSFGTVVFALAVLRIAWRLAAGCRPANPQTMPRWQVKAARVSHVLFYILMVALPLSGWLLASASPLNDAGAVPFQVRNLVFDRFELPDPFATGSASLTATLTALHLALALMLAALLALHSAAALKHHFIDRDDVLRRMIGGG